MKILVGILALVTSLAGMSAAKGAAQVDPRSRIPGKPGWSATPEAGFDGREHTGRGTGVHPAAPRFGVVVRREQA